MVIKTGVWALNGHNAGASPALWVLTLHAIKRDNMGQEPPFVNADKGTNQRLTLRE